MHHLSNTKEYMHHMQFCNHGTKSICSAQLTQPHVKLKRKKRKKQFDRQMKSFFFFFFIIRSLYLQTSACNLHVKKLRAQAYRKKKKLCLIPFGFNLFDPSSELRDKALHYNFFSFIIIIRIKLFFFFI